MSTEDIKYGYCTEIMVRFESGKEPFYEARFREELSKLGDSLLVVSDDEIVKVHIHTETPGVVLNEGQKYGSLIKIKVDNMREQHSAIVNAPEKTKAENKAGEKHPYAVVAVAMGEGISNMLKSIGASYVIEGGQTMNPSTEDIVKAVKEIGAEKVIILPNNKNIIMAAEQAAELLDIEAAVVPSKTIPQGMAAILAFNPEASVEENKEAMTEAMAGVKTGQITFAVRDTTIDGIEIHKDDYMAIADGKIIASMKDKSEAARNLLSELMDDETEIVTMIYGEGVTEEEVDAISGWIEEQYPDVELDIVDGKQTLYPFIFSVE